MSHLFRSVQNTARVVAEAAHPWAGATEHDRNCALAEFGLWLIRVESDPINAASILAEFDQTYAGRIEWRNRFMRHYRGWRLVDEGCADDMLEQVRNIFQRQWPGMKPAEVMDAWAPPSPITQAEIDAGWELHSESCEEARKYFYGDRWDAPHRVMEELNDPKAHDPIEVRT